MLQMLYILSLSIYCSFKCMWKALYFLLEFQREYICIVQSGVACLSLYSCTRAYKRWGFIFCVIDLWNCISCCCLSLLCCATAAAAASANDNDDDDYILSNHVAHNDKSNDNWNKYSLFFSVFLLILVGIACVFVLCSCFVLISFLFFLVLFRLPQL